MLPRLFRMHGNKALARLCLAAGLCACLPNTHAAATSDTPPTEAKATRYLFPQFSESTGARIESKGLRGNASFYGAKFHGRKTATGEIFNNKLFTAASNLFPLGSLVIVKRPDTNLCVVVKINDRMHARRGSRVIDVSHSAASYLDMVREGVVKVQIMPLPNSTANGSAVDCAMGFELEETCSDCDDTMQSLISGKTKRNRLMPPEEFSGTNAIELPLTR